MLKRIGSALVGIAILLAVYFSKNNIVFNIAVVIVSVLGLNEFYNAVRKKGIRPIEFPGYICCLLLGLVGFVDNEKILLPVIFTAMPIIFFILSTIYIFSKLIIKFTDLAVTILGIIYVPIMMLFLILTWQMKNGYLLVWFIFGGAWLTDTFAFFIGKVIGKHKFSKISPNKSIEGCIAGLIGGALFYGVYSYFLNTNHLVEIGGSELNIALMTFIGSIISIISQIGDFTASAIKRQCDIKDFGSIMPGHGGVLDRFDSIIMIAPFVYILFEFIV
ncbi:MAG: phosphatidate cytidylyltransferase [Clostridia bacterium]|nr:phosphatidate cytidylyltransferase [Clostridia bacterium]